MITNYGIKIMELNIPLNSYNYLHTFDGQSSHIIASFYYCFLFKISPPPKT